MNLCIVGNGLDLAHGYRTKYTDFKEWMKKRLPPTTSLDNIPGLPDVMMGQHGENIIDEKGAIIVLMWLFTHNYVLDNTWSNFEESLYYLDLQDLLDENSWFVDDNARDKEGDINPFWQGAYYREFAEAIWMSVRYTYALFQRWLEEVDIGESNLLPCICDLAKESVFLSFNYTETLEKMYRISPEKVCHIHGVRNNPYTKDVWIGSPLPKRLIIGHGNRSGKDFSGVNIEAADVFDEIIKELRKPTDEIIKAYSGFWGALRRSDINKVYSFGFGYGDVDLPYIEHVCRLLRGRNATWYLYTYNEEQNRKAESQIRKCGFDGDFGRYT